MNFHWRRFRIADIPLDDAEKFDLWLREQWYRKDELMEQYLTTGRLPAMSGSKVDYVHAEVKTRQPWEILQVFTILGIVGLISNNIRKSFETVSKILGR